MHVTFINAQLPGPRIGSLRIDGPRIAGLDMSPEAGDTVVDLQGDRLLPGFINGHDHLQLNSLPALDPPKIYPHVRDWISEIDARRRTDPQFAARVAVSRDERLLQGAVKNLLSGVTTVAHHDPLYPFLTHADCPVSVLCDYGWAHSPYLDSETSLVGSYRATPIGWPWIVHAAEGINAEASNEFEHLDRLGCVQANSLLVHGIALDTDQRARLLAAGAGLIWCPSSNMRLFGRTAQIADLAAQKRVALGTDSRLSGSRDLLEEIRLAAALQPFAEEDLAGLVTHVAARLLRLSDRGTLRAGLRSDLLILPAGKSLACTDRRDVRLVMVNGAVRYGQEDYVERARPNAEWTSVLIDGVPKMLDRQLAQRLQQARAGEPGLEFPYLTGRAA
jgi:cytosine/adenosine deaminase-related metal-dependent hydrolase